LHFHPKGSFFKNYPQKHKTKNPPKNSRKPKKASGYFHAQKRKEKLKMSKIKLEKTKNPKTEKYYLIDNELTLRAKGLLTQLKAIPETLDFNLESLTSLTKDEIKSIRTATTELETHGYLDRYQKRNPQGQFLPVEYTIYNRPQDNPYHCAKLNNPTFTDTDNDDWYWDFETDEETNYDDWDIDDYDDSYLTEDWEEPKDEYAYLHKVMELMGEIFDELLENARNTAKKN